MQIAIENVIGIKNIDKKLEQQLVKDFPLTFYRDPNGREPWSMFGIETRNGWHDSIRKTAERLEPLLKVAKETDPEGYKAGFYRTAQLKEKMGTGRWYLSGGTDEMQEIVSEWEHATFEICETCGKPGITKGSWMYTVCLEHTAKEDMDGLEIVEDAYIKSEETKNA
ncbi:MAG: hypothetical protein ACREBR_04610 [bacterium]